MEHWRNAALLLLGHGSSRNPQSSAPTYRLAAALRAQELFGRVEACFWKEAPHVREVLAQLRQPSGGEPPPSDIYLVPNFTGEGYFTREIIPRELGLEGAVTPVFLPEAGEGGQGETQRLHYTPAVGNHPRLATFLLGRCRRLLQRQGWAASEVGVLLVGHGSGRRPGRSSQAAQALATRLAAELEGAEVVACFLEEPPLVAEWPRHFKAQRGIVIPLLIAEGLHGGEDLPPLFGLSPRDLQQGGDADTILGPILHEGRTLFYCRGIASDQEVISIILDHVAACSTESDPPPIRADIP